MKHINVVAAIFISDQNNIFCTRRKNIGELALKWEFPGGKIEPNETKEQALKRELLEELEIDITVLRPFLSVHHQYKSFEITLDSFLCSANLDKYLLNDHVEARWVPINELLLLDWADADLPIVKKILEVFN